MNRFAFKLLVFLLLGAIINVAVAWGFSISGSEPRGQSFHDGTEEAVLKRTFGDNLIFVPETLGGKKASAIGVASSHVVAIASDNSQTETAYSYYEKRVGLPVHSMVGRLRAIDLQTYTESAWLLPNRTAGDWGAYEWYHNLVPLRPLWPGFAINTIFYAAIVWALFAVPGAVRRRVRIRRGQCARCAYPGGTNEKCTECGAAVRESSHS